MTSQPELILPLQIADINDLPLTYDDEKYHNTCKTFSDAYEFCAMLGKGSFGVVISAFTRTDERKKVAIKVIDKRPLKKMNLNFDKEEKILRELNHPSIVRFFNSYESSRAYILVMEYFEGVSLDQFIQNRIEKPFSNEQIRSIIEKILQAILHMHSMEVLHRDLKPENILIRQHEESPNSFEIKIIDFGLSYKNEFSEGKVSVQDNCGTLIFMAPEIAFNRQYQRSIDIWSCGIIQFMLFSMGQHPLWRAGDDRNAFLEKLKAPAWNFPASMDEQSRSFFLKTAAINPDVRMTAAQCLKHVWISQEGTLADPNTINEIFALFSKQQTILRVTKTLMILSHLRDTSISKGYTVVVPRLDPGVVAADPAPLISPLSRQFAPAFQSQPNLLTLAAVKTLPKRNQFNSFEISSTSSDSSIKLGQLSHPATPPQPYYNPARKYSRNEFERHSPPIITSSSNHINIVSPHQQLSSPQPPYNKQQLKSSIKIKNNNLSNNTRFNSISSLSSVNGNNNSSRFNFAANQSTSHDIFFSSMSEIHRLQQPTSAHHISHPILYHANSAQNSAQSSPLKLPPINSNIQSTHMMTRSPKKDHVVSHRPTRSVISNSLSPQTQKLQKPAGIDKTLQLRPQPSLSKSSSPTPYAPSSLNNISINQKSQFYKEQSRSVQESLHPC